MSDKLYIIYCEDGTYGKYDDYEPHYYVTDKYFTSKEKAEEYADYLEMVSYGTFDIQEVTNGDDIDVAPLIEECKRKEEEESKRNARKNRLNNVDCYALYKSRVEGSSYGNLLSEFKLKYADYVDNGADWADDGWNVGD